MKMKMKFRYDGHEQTIQTAADFVDFDFDLIDRIVGVSPCHPQAANVKPRKPLSTAMAAAV